MCVRACVRVREKRAQERKTQSMGEGKRRSVERARETDTGHKREIGLVYKLISCFLLMPAVCVSLRDRGSAIGSESHGASVTEPAALSQPLTAPQTEHTLSNRHSHTHRQTGSASPALETCLSVGVCVCVCVRICVCVCAPGVNLVVCICVRLCKYVYVRVGDCVMKYSRFFQSTFCS